MELRCFSSNCKPTLPSSFSPPETSRTSVTASFSGGVSLGPTTTTTRDVPSFRGMKLKNEFSDLGHLHYYHTPRPRQRFCVVTANDKKNKNKNKAKAKDNDSRTKKNKLKLLKDLSQNLSMFTDIDSSQLQADHLSEAADVVLKQLEKLRAEEKELKKRSKEDKAKLKAQRMQTKIDDDSSSSSSESSDNDCGEVIDMNRLRSQKPALYYDDSQSAAAQVAAVLATRLPSLPTTNASEQHCSGELHKHENESERGKRVEVCMGNKCKKSGSVALMEEFTRQMGGEGAVVGCKCMGKCRSAPNVRVMNTTSVEGATETDDACLSVTTANHNPLCLGVGLEDVTAIVASLLGDDTRDFGLAAAV